MKKQPDFTRPVRTRDGREVRIYATDGAGNFPVHGAIRDESGWTLRTWDLFGAYYPSHFGEHDEDLFQEGEGLDA